MIVIRNTTKDQVINVIRNTEVVNINGLSDNIELIKLSSKEVTESIQKYIQQNAVIKGIETNIRNNISNRSDLLQGIEFALGNADKLLGIILQYFKSTNTKIFDTSTITFKEKGMFDWLNAINFFSRYTATILDLILEQPKNVSDYLVKNDVEFMNKTAGYYNTILKRLCGSFNELKRSLDMLSNETYDADNEEILSSVKGKEATTVGLLPHHLNPYYWVRFVDMKLDIAIIKSSREKIDSYAMKVQNLENQLSNNPDPAIQRRLEYWRDEIIKLDAKISDIEAKYA